MLLQECTRRSPQLIEGHKVVQRQEHNGQRTRSIGVPIIKKVYRTDTGKNANPPPSGERAYSQMSRKKIMSPLSGVPFMSDASVDRRHRP